MLLYIDPGTGSMLFTLLLGIITTLFFFLQRLFIKIKFLSSGGRIKPGEVDKNVMPFVIFSDNKRYWNVFKPVCDEFERRGIKAWYWTASPDDQALEEDYKFITCQFIGEDNKAFTRLNIMSADICLSTTPGLDVYQWKRSKNVKYYVHMLHAVGSAAGYRMFGLDYFDAVLLSGKFQVNEIRELEEKRGLPAKDLQIVGCTYLDVMRNRLSNSNTGKNSTITVLLAPSWGKSSILCKYGERIIECLIQTGYKIIIRPHPQSVTADKVILEKLQNMYPNGQSVTWNYDIDNFDVLNNADIMISDFSGVMFDYALVFDKPIIYTETASFDSAPYDAAWLDKPLWKFNIYPTLGRELSEEDFPDMKRIINEMINDTELRKGREAARLQAWEHIGESAERITDYLICKRNELINNVTS